VREDVRSDLLVEETGLAPDELGVDGESRLEVEAARVALVAQHRQRGPGPLGVDVIGRDRRDATEVVDAEVEQSRGVVAQIGRRLEVDRRGQDQARDGDRPVELLVARGRLVAIAVRGLGRKFWMITSWT
jgi:hypothetical protein